MGVDRSGKSHPPRGRVFRHRQCTEVAAEGSRGEVMVVVAVVETERGGGTVEGQHRDCSRHQDCIVTVDEVRNGEGMVGIVLGDGCQVVRDLNEGLGARTTLGVCR